MIVRTLTFEDRKGLSKDEALSMLYNGFLTGGQFVSQSGATNRIELARREAVILDKFEMIADVFEPLPNAPNREYSLVLRDGQNEMNLTQPEYELLKRNFEATPWTTKMSRQVITISDWLSSVPAQEV